MDDQADIAEQITAGCLMGRTRYLSRVLTAMYDAEMRPLGVQATQVTLLAFVAAYGPLRRSDLGRWLQFDSSTLTRNLRVMLANTWLEEAPDATDGRSRLLQATAAGKDLLRAVGPAWRKAQDRAVDVIGNEGRLALTGLFDTLQSTMAT